MPDEPQAQPAVGQDPPVPAPIGDGPWAQDLATLFPDAAARTVVDGFLRSKVQPYTTQLEQQVAQTKDAARLWNDLESNPVDTFVAITTEMFGEEVGNGVLEAVRASLEGSQAPEAEPATPPQEVPQMTDPRMDEALQWVETQRQTQLYESEMARVATDHPEVDTSLLHAFVAAAGGDFEQAVGLYKQFESDYRVKAGLVVPEVPAPAAPAVIGSDTTGAAASTTPVEPRKQTLHGAIEEFMREQRTPSAPPVGTV